MCGIVGVVKKDCKVDPNEFHSFTQSLIHRGPDDVDCYVRENIGLGHTRLKIIDLSDDSNQPMISDCGNYVLIYNGEIYNYIELRQSLIALGHQFKTTGDTEVLLKAYLTWGVEAFNRFNGMWAFVIYDIKENKLIGSRDRFGIKPLYYSLRPDGFYFSSEIKPLLAMGVPARPNCMLVQDFLLTQITDHSEETFFDNILVLKPGCNFEYNISTHEFKSRYYYHLKEILENAQHTQQNSQEHFFHLLEDSVNIRMRADTEVGSCLSGGLDSSSVASLAHKWLRRKNSEQSLIAFTAVSTDPNNDESYWANAVAQQHGMRTVQITPTYEQFLEQLPNIVKTQEEPFGGPSIVMQYLLMQKVSESKIKVLLDGQGGDELLLGYPKYTAAYLLSIMRDKGPVAAFQHAREYIANNTGQSYASLLKFFLATYSSTARYKAYQRLMPFFQNAGSTPEFLRSYSKDSKKLPQLQALECMSTNLPPLLRYEDKNSMAFGIETRLPFLDHRLLEYSISLPLEHKINQGWSKWILRDSMRQHLPEEVLWRKNKVGFEAPEHQWLTMHANEMRHVIKGSAIIGDLTHAKKLSLSLQHLNSKALWRLYSVAMWEKTMKVSG